MERIWLGSLVMPVLLGFLLFIGRSVAVARVGPPTNQHLYVVSESVNPAAPGRATGELSIVDPATGRAIAAFPVGVNADIATSRDGSRLYVASVDPSTERDHLIAIDPRGRTTLWTTVIQYRVKYIDWGPVTLALSPDGRRLYVHSYATAPASRGPGHVSDWLQVVDATTGRILPKTIPLPDCGTAELDIAPSNATMVVTCYGGGDVRFVDLATNRVVGTLRILHPTDLAGGPEGLVGAALSTDGTRLDVVTNTAPFSRTFHVAEIDVERRLVTHWLDLRGPSARKLPEGFVAFSADLNRLAVGENVQAVPGTDTATELQVFDVDAAREARRIQIAQPLAYRLAFAPDGRTLYALGQGDGATGREPVNTVYAIDAGRQPRPFFTRDGEGIAQIFLGP